MLDNLQPPTPHTAGTAPSVGLSIVGAQCPKPPPVDYPSPRGVPPTPGVPVSQFSGPVSFCGPPLAAIFGVPL